MSIFEQGVLKRNQNYLTLEKHENEKKVAQNHFMEKSLNALLKLFLKKQNVKLFK